MSAATARTAPGMKFASGPASGGKDQLASSCSICCLRPAAAGARAARYRPAASATGMPEPPALLPQPLALFLHHKWSAGQEQVLGRHDVDGRGLAEQP